MPRHLHATAQRRQHRAPSAFAPLSNLVNRHGCITGATGIGKNVTLQVIAEALVSFLDEKGHPHIVKRAFIVPPASRIGPIVIRGVLGAILKRQHYATPRQPR